MGKGIVMLDVVKGARRELGWEVGYVAVNGTTLQNPVAAVVLDNDADFVVTRIWAGQFGADSPILFPDSILIQVRDSATGNTMLRQPGRVASFCSMPFAGFNPLVTPGPINPSARFVSNALGLPSPYLLRRGSSAFIEFFNPDGYTWKGDIWVAFEGFRVYPGQEDQVPNEVKGYALPYSWNGTITPGVLAAGLKQLGTIEAAGPGPGRYILKVGAISCTGAIAPVIPGGGAPVVPPADCVLFAQVRDTTHQGKFWVRATNQPALGTFVPAAFMTGGGAGAPWAHPRYIDGQSKIFIDIFGDSDSFVGNDPGTIEVDLLGVNIPTTAPQT
jgi:hypothetical protein